ncbi:hypothetical protein BT96DRAFT_1039235 [Gymnopus androsaceus JB14]|uniref:DUF6533 domain-containing protein n=1 Tax=Gymnopus androsaceus JB14 TaxID=1447944 RepID=A0A6A4HHJ9_9AGAR|nr:hypothetical protein BT96DRAFT_1039235 [Gymnopus androsaceus JB14]
MAMQNSFPLYTSPIITTNKNVLCSSVCSVPPMSQETLATAALHLNAAKYFQLAGYAMLIYDHLITFGDEVERVWKRKFTGATLLFFLNRYLTPVQFALILDAFHNPAWEGEMVMILRVWALYNCKLPVLAVLFTVLVAQVVVGAYGIHNGFPVPLPPQLVGCIFTGTTLFAALWFGPLVTDVFIFMFTLWRTRTYFTARGRGSTPTIELFVRDGVLYFLVIFSVNLLNILIYFAVEDLKAIGASFSQLMTSVMISRLVLNLRSVGESKDEFITQPGMQFVSNQRSYSRKEEETFMTRTIGDLGGDLKSGFYDTDENNWEDSTTVGAGQDMELAIYPRAY